MTLKLSQGESLPAETGQITDGAPRREQETACRGSEEEPGQLEADLQNSAPVASGPCFSPGCQPRLLQAAGGF